MVNPEVDIRDLLVNQSVISGRTPASSPTTEVADGSAGSSASGTLTLGGADSIATGTVFFFDPTNPGVVIGGDDKFGNIVGTVSGTVDYETGDFSVTSTTPWVTLTAQFTTQTEETTTLVAGTNLFRGFVREPQGSNITLPSVTVIEDGTGRMEPYLESSGADWVQAPVTVYVFGNRNNYSQTYTLANEVLLLCHKASILGYTQILALQARPQKIEDDEGRPIFSFTLSAEYKRT